MLYWQEKEEDKRVTHGAFTLLIPEGGPKHA